MSLLLVLNAGSSSVKLAGFDADGGLTPRFRGQVDGLGELPHLVVRDAAGHVLIDRRWPAGATLTHAESFTVLRDWLRSHAGGAIRGVGHRIVHGGTRYAAPVQVDAAVLAELDALVPLAPLHQPQGLAIMRAIAAHDPQWPQVACFDTAFHRTLPPLAQRFALPRALHEAGVRRYGFHGLSYDSVARRLRAVDAQAAAGRVVVAHLGAGASLCALRDGRSVETTMSFTALDGLPMATRCGALDPGVLLYLLQAQRMPPEALSRLLYQESGLLGVSGLSGDMRVLAASPLPAAREAVALFAYRIRRELGALVAVLGGLDALVFTAGIGEHDAGLRAAVCDDAGWLGVALDPAANAAHALRISAGHSAIKVFVIPTDEEQLIATLAQGVLA